MNFLITHPEDLDRMWRQLERMKLPIEVTTRALKTGGASQGQIGLYKLWVVPLAAHCGNSFGDMDRDLRRMYLPVAHHDVLGKQMERLTVLEDLTKPQMTEFLTHVQLAADELGVRLPSTRGD